jgi:hypothetical protein
MIHDVRKILAVPGKLCTSPTDFTTAYPHGGTALGTIRDAQIIIEQPYQFIIAEEYGNARYEGIITGEGVVFGATLLSWDKDMLAKIFPNTSVGAVSGKTVVTSPSTIRPGEPMSSRAVALCFSPDDPDRNPGLLIRKAIPAIKETSELSCRIDQEFGIPVLWYGIRDASDRVYSVGLLRDIVLP